MRKGITYLGLIVSLILFAYIVFNLTKPSLHFETDDNGNFSLSFATNTKTEKILPWLDEETGIYYFFLPSFATKYPISFSSDEENPLYIDGTAYTSHQSLNWKENTFYHIANPYINTTIALTCSDNIPSMFITTEHKNKSLLYEDTEYSDSGSICTYTENGNLQYNGLLEKISGRGNQTWTRPKKPFSIKLSENAPLCGLESGKKWVLLAMFYESTNLTTKLALDIAQEMGLAYTSQSTWVDLYIDGDYAGLYLLTEQVCVDENRVDIYDLEKENEQINGNLDAHSTYVTEKQKGYLLEQTRTLSGGYLIEKELPDRYGSVSTGFITDGNYTFAVKHPAHASAEQVSYISNYFQTIENLIYSNSNACFDYIDIESFAKKFLLEEFFYNYDANYTSSFFYKDINSDYVYCGPAWDYDNSMCRNMTCTDYTGTILSKTDNIKNACLDWWNYLYENETFYKTLRECYIAILPTLIEYHDSIIDDYVNHIYKASQMDSIRWDYSAQYFFNDYYNNVRHLKFFWQNRIEYLCERWNVPNPAPTVNKTNTETHTVTFMIYTEEGSEIIETMEVPDGYCIEVLPELPAEDWQPWFFLKPNMTLTDKIPIYEDIEVHSYRMY